MGCSPSELSAGASAEKELKAVRVLIVEELDVIQEARGLLDLIDEHQSGLLLSSQFSDQEPLIGFVSSAEPPVLKIDGKTRMSFRNLLQ
jgi:hypothetical protein